MIWIVVAVAIIVVLAGLSELTPEEILRASHVRRAF
jgi:hypothetical protein